jgi:hypothetical protein
VKGRAIQIAISMDSEPLAQKHASGKPLPQYPLVFKASSAKVAEDEQTVLCYDGN